MHPISTGEKGGVLLYSRAFFLLFYAAMDSVVFFDHKTVDEPEASRSLLVRNLNRGLKVEALLEELEVSHGFPLSFIRLSVC